MKVCHFRSVPEVSMWTRYTSSGTSGSRKGLRIEGALVNGGMGPEETELGVEAPDEAGVDAGVFRRDDFAMAGVFSRDRRLDSDCLVFSWNLYDCLSLVQGVQQTAEVFIWRVV
jgi:hypothetical protein